MSTINPKTNPERFEKCPYCGGEGEWEESRPQRDDPDYAINVRCDECNGSGWVYADPNDDPKNEGIDPMRGVEFPFAENH